MKRVSWLVLISLVAFFPHVAMAKDFCFSFGGVDLIFKAFKAPAKGTCKSIIEVVPSVPGLVSSGAGCTTSDGAILLFTLSDGMDGIETIQGSISLANGTGLGTDCFAGDSLATSCLQGAIAVETCAKKAPPITAPAASNLTSRGPLLAR